ncbi:3-phosphoglycerate dehydrogenase [Synergistales bacterium]|nr:3-phosphoglycerate dehydrogenase [Synergistales bacterium]
MKAVIIDKVSTLIGPALEKRGIHVDYKMLPTKQELIELLPDYELLIMRVDPKIDKEILDAGKKLKAIAVCSVGTNHVDLEYASKKGIPVFNAPGANSNAVAELTISKMLDLSRMTIGADYESRVGRLWNKYNWIGTELKNKTVGIIGFGRIGSRVCELALAFGMRVLANDIKVSNEEITARGAIPVSKEELFKESDFVTVHTPLTPETKNMISKDQIALIKEGAYLINTARGGILDEAAAYDALKAGKLRGVSIDVLSAELAGEGLTENAKLESVLYESDCVLVSPHIGGGTIDAYDAIGEVILAKLAEIS